MAIATFFLAQRKASGWNRIKRISSAYAYREKITTRKASCMSTTILSAGEPTHENSETSGRESMKLYKTILADPPWPIKWNASAAIGKKHIEYPTLPVSEICSLPVHSIADADCTLFLWTTNGFLPEALGVLRHWKFHYKMLFTWCKNNGMGGHPRNATEHMIIATRGEPASDRHASATLNWLEHPRIGHSEKPEAFREVIERLSPEPRIELFARRRVAGWAAWGNEVDSDIDLANATHALDAQQRLALDAEKLRSGSP